MYKLKLGKSVRVFDGDYYEVLENLKAYGFESVDVDLCACGFFNRAEELEELKKRMSVLKESGLFFNGVHIPYGTEWDISEADEKKRKEAVKNVLTTIAFMDAYRPNCYVLHGSFEPIMDKERNAKLCSLIQSVKEIKSATKTPVGIENLPRTCLLNTSDEILYVAEQTGGMDVCLDVNHFLRERTENAIPKLSGMIVTTHISDHDYANERHWLPKEGKINWQKLLFELEKSGYNGVFNYEVLGSIGIADIKKNYEELFEAYNGKKL